MTEHKFIQDQAILIQPSISYDGIRVTSPFSPSSDNGDNCIINGQYSLETLCSKININDSSHRDWLAKAIRDNYLRYTQRYLGVSGMWEEALNDSALKVISAIERDIINPKQNFSAYCFRIVANTCIDYHRREKVRQKGEDEQPLDGTSPDGSFLDNLTKTTTRHIEELIEQKFLRQQLREAFQAIPQEQAVVLCLSYYENLTHSQIAEQLNLPLGTVKARIRLGLKKLKSLLKDLPDQ